MKEKCIRTILCLCLCLFALAGCVREDRYENTPLGNFQQLWKIIDEEYCFLDFKQIDWQTIGRETQNKISPQMSDEELFTLLNNMLFKLEDGHVSLSSDTRESHYPPWSKSASNFNKNVIENDRYLGTNYRNATGMKYKIIAGDIGYVYYESFLNSINEEALDKMFSYFAHCRGLIIDVRQNGGGNVTNSAIIASRFLEKKTLTGYIRHKTGSGHSDFSKPYPVYLEPSNGRRWQKKAAVLSNRHAYSAANDFVCQMKGLPNVLIMGDTSGGGAGMPFTSELPNGWVVHFSASPHYDSRMECIEWGIEPDRKVDMNKTEEDKGIDTIIEAACQWLHE